MRNKSFGYTEASLSIFDKIIRFLRFKRIIDQVPNGSKILDLGCGYQAELLINLTNKIKHGVGGDIYVKEKIKHQKITLVQVNVNQKLPFKEDSFDVVTSLALIEHITKPSVHLKEIYRVLKPGGKLLLTTPDKKSKWLLETAAFKLGIISKDEIADHKRYYDSSSLLEALLRAGFSRNKIDIKTFLFGFNIFVKTEK